MNAKIKSIILGVIVAFVVVSAAPAPQASAEGPAPAAPQSDGCNSGFTIFPRWYEGLCSVDSKGSVKIKSPADMEGADTGEKFGKWATVLALNIVSMLLYAVGYVSLAFIIYGGFKYMTSGDNSSGVQAAQKTIQNAVIGLVLSIMSVAIVTFVTRAIG